jgi:FkbM family methyltransferase
MTRALTGLARRGYLPAVVYDIGAAEGAWTRLAASVWPDAKFVCFEPLEEREATLTRLAADLPGRVQTLLIGLGSEDADLAMGVADGLWASSFAYAGASQRTLPVRRLDGLLAKGDLPAPSFLKIDVQGFELRVLEGARERALTTTDFILMECQFFAFCDDMRTLDHTIAHMSQLGYVPYEFVDFLRRPLDDAMGQCDILFARRDHVLVSDVRWS